MILAPFACIVITATQWEHRLKVCFRTTQELCHRQVKAHDDCYDNQFYLLDPVVDVLILSFFFYNYKV